MFYLFFYVPWFQAKFVYVCLILSASQLSFATASAASKNDARFKSDQKKNKKYIILCKIDDSLMLCFDFQTIKK